MPEESQQPAPQPQVTATTKSTNWKKVILTIVFIVGVAAVVVGVYWFMVVNKSSGDSDLTGPVPKVTTKTPTESGKEATPSGEKDETADWKSYENKEYNYSLKYPNNWNVSMETKVVSEENNIVYHYYAVSKKKNQTEGATDQVMVIRYLEGDPCASMEITKSDATVSGYKSQRSDCYENDKLKVIIFSFPNTTREEWFIVAYVDKDLDKVEEIISTVEFLD